MTEKGKGEVKAMVRKQFLVAVLVCTAAVLWGATSVAIASEDVPRITKEELMERRGDPGVVVIDVRYTQNWNKSKQKIAGAVREDPNDIGLWLDKYGKDQLLVLYCD